MFKDWTQAAALILTIIGGVWYLSLDIEGVRHDSMHAIDLLNSRLAADEEKITALRDAEAGHFAEEVSFRGTIQTTLNSVITALADLRVQLASANNRNHGSK